ncbi:Transposable element Tcb1 transposase [Paramuricea clavata]|uniref:Transposable element Tcb1 transposase n=1 Tax=Paramuricea clavata TaxID=317549 RepID=A0A7D9D6S7_PARCT|nr:Transposable element Tcb1 transposase [Paramuricea clavata]
MSKTSVQRVIKRFDTKNTNTKKLKKSYQGRRKSLTERDERKLKRAIIQLREKSPNFTVMEVVQRSGISPTIATYRTFLRYVKRLGYGFFQSRKKGVLTKKDLKIHRKFARSMATKPQDYWTSDVSFYLDGVSFIYKSNPMSDVLKPKNRVWRKRGEGLLLTTKGSKELAGGKRLHLLVAMAHGHGVICAEPYVKMDGPYFARFIRRHFPILFDITSNNDNTKPKLFVMDNDPSQTSAVARKALKSIKASMQVIPARSPDLNPIENLFHIVRKKIEAEILQKNVIYQSWDEFVERVKFNIWSVSQEYVDKTIASMPRRIKDIVKHKGKRTKY